MSGRRNRITRSLSERCIGYGLLISRRSLKEHLAQYEKELVQAGIRRFKSIRKTARHLGVSHTTVLNKMKKYGISKKDIFY